MKKNIIVTGGLGFVGKNFIRNFLNEFDKIILIDKLTFHSDEKFFNEIEKKKIEFHQEDIANFAFNQIAQLNSYEIINFASESHVDRSFSDPVFFSNTNYLSTHKFLENLRLQNFTGRLLHVSTDEVYGESIEQEATEEFLLKPTNPYSVSKAAADILCQTYNKCFNLDIVIVRPNNLYGAYQHIEKIIPATISSLHKNKKVKIQGDGYQRRSFLNISDFNNACKLLFDLDWKNFENRIYNISSKNEYTILDLVKKIIGFAGKEINDYIEFVQDRQFNDNRYLTSSKKIENLGWIEKVNFDSELKKLYDSYSVFFGNENK